MQKILLLETQSNKKEMKAKGDVNPAIKWMQFIEDEKKIAQIFLFGIFLISHIENWVSSALFVEIS